MKFLIILFVILIIASARKKRGDTTRSITTKSSFNSPSRQNDKLSPWDTSRKNGNAFHDDPFFNPWAPGGNFNKNGRWGSGRRSTFNNRRGR